MPVQITPELVVRSLSDLQAEAPADIGAMRAWNYKVVARINRYLDPRSSYAQNATKLIDGDANEEDRHTWLRAMIDSIISDVEANEILLAGEAGYYEAYAAFTTKLRMWLMYYGLSLIASIITTQNLFHIGIETGIIGCVVALLLVGLGAQILLMVAYKFIMWFLYAHEIGVLDRRDNKYRYSNRLSTNVALELIPDVITIVCLVWATICLAHGISSSISE